MARLRDCASVERSSTSLLKTPGGGPAIDSNAMVGPTAVPGASETFDVVLSVVQPETSAPKSTHTQSPRADARLCPDPVTRAPPCDPALRFLPTRRVPNLKYRQTGGTVQPSISRSFPRKRESSSFVR